ncbi:hypothetical protein HUG10_09460 [Halorarum halophilum]|uniref:Uncharacterized protein n=1 Tax=Halorarum halophilum TaxID=2743090 RepID=A0A7D5GL35_9EURY|nr:hypothetical protein [Halobaculum halophilum]QLG27767.1 hypothetical protein HUG10_09460 [Halobaculum halophilum]
MRSPSVASFARGFAALSLLGLVLSVTAVAVVAVGAESVQTWGTYFLMEQAMAVGTPLVLAFAGCSLVAGFLLVWVAGDGERGA